jgi:hypothetical protein
MRLFLENLRRLWEEWRIARRERHGFDFVGRGSGSFELPRKK